MLGAPVSRHLKLLFIDDNPIALQWAEEMFEGPGISVFTYNKSFGIIAHVQHIMPDVVFVDVRMPAVNGDVVCSTIKEHPHTKNIRVFLYSTIEETRLSSLARSCGADGFVVKSSNPQLLLKRVQEVLTEFLRPTRAAEGST